MGLLADRLKGSKGKKCIMSLHLSILAWFGTTQRGRVEDKASNLMQSNGRWLEENGGPIIRSEVAVRPLLQGQKVCYMQFQILSGLQEQLNSTVIR